MDKTTKILVIALVAFVLIIGGLSLAKKFVFRASPESRPMTLANFSGIKLPPENPSQEDLRVWDSYIASKAATSTSLAVTKCRPSPTVLSTRVGATIFLKNTDSVAHKVRFSSDLSFTAQPGTTTPVKMQFPRGKGTYTYSCDDRGIVGAVRLI